MSARTDELITPDLVEAIAGLARRGGDEILDVYAAGGATETKVDGSPVTEADTRAEAVIVAGLSQLTPEIPVLAEEKVSSGDIPDLRGGLFWLVDPLDGTKEFISRNGEFTVNIALVDDGTPVFGVVHLPALDTMYLGVVGSAGRAARAERRTADGAEAISVRPVPTDGYDVLTSRSHSDQATEDYLAKLQVRERVSAGSSLKFCRVAEGAADLYPRLGRTMEWDTGAGHAVVLAAGGGVCTYDGAPLGYGKDGHDNPAFLAYGVAPPPL